MMDLFIITSSIPLYLYAIHFKIEKYSLKKGNVQKLLVYLLLGTRSTAHWLPWDSIWIWKSLPEAGFGNMAPYQWAGSTDIDFAADEVGLWVSFFHHSFYKYYILVSGNLCNASKFTGCGDIAARSCHSWCSKDLSNQLEKTMVGKCVHGLRCIVCSEKIWRKIYIAELYV